MDGPLCPASFSATTFPPSLPRGGQPTSSPSNNEGNINLITNPQKLRTYPEQYWPASPPVVAPQYLICGTATPSPQINFVGTQFSVPVDNTANFPTGPTNCGFAASQNSCSQVFAQDPQGAVMCLAPGSRVCLSRSRLFSKAGDRKEKFLLWRLSRTIACMEADWRPINELRPGHYAVGGSIGGMEIDKVALIAPSLLSRIASH